MLQTRTVYPDTLGLLKELMKEPLLSNHFLVGGTSLALQMGHRFSVDLDLFTHTDFKIEIDGIRLTDIRDVAPMKLDAVMKRGNKKDFFDMYYLFEQFSPTQIMDWYKAMFKHDTTFHVVRSLVYFEDAEQTEMPVVFDKKVSWTAVKKHLIEVVRENF